MKNFLKTEIQKCHTNYTTNLFEKLTNIYTLQLKINLQVTYTTCI